MVVVRAVAVGLAVAEVVLPVVGGEVGEGEAVVRGHEVQRGERTARLGEPGARPRQLVRHRPGRDPGETPVAHHVEVRQPEVAHRVAVAVVPLGPALGEAAGLPPAEPHVPRLGDELDAGEERVLVDHVEE